MVIAFLTTEGVVQLAANQDVVAFTGFDSDRKINFIRRVENIVAASLGRSNAVAIADRINEFDSLSGQVDRDVARPWVNQQSVIAAATVQESVLSTVLLDRIVAGPRINVVGPQTGKDIVVAVAPDDHIVTISSIERITELTAGQDVVAPASVKVDTFGQHVAAVQGVVAVLRVDNFEIDIRNVKVNVHSGRHDVQCVAACTTIESTHWIGDEFVIGTIQNQADVDAQFKIGNRVISVTSIEGVASAATVERVVAVAADQNVIAGLTLQVVTAGTAFDQIFTATAGDRVVTAFAAQDVVAFTAVGSAKVINVASNVVVAITAADRVIAFTTGQGVVESSSNQYVITGDTIENGRCVSLPREVQRVVLMGSVGSFEFTVEGVGSIIAIDKRDSRMVPVEAERVDAGTNVGDRNIFGGVIVGDRVIAIVTTANKGVRARSAGQCASAGSLIQNVVA